jgi:DNA-directed RNA polymerase specialized sigma24 family protein
MGETMLLHDQGGMLSRSQANSEFRRTACTDHENVASQSIGGTIDWSAKLAEHDRWLRTMVLARLGERQAVDDVMQEVALAAVAQRTRFVISLESGRGYTSWP